MPLDTTIQAQYEDGFILDETKLKDVSPYDEGRNILGAILDKSPEAEHGKMVRFSGFWKGEKYDIDWTTLPDNARPIRFRHGFATMSATGQQITMGWSGMDFGYQYTDDGGNNVQDVIEVR